MLQNCLFNIYFDYMKKVWLFFGGMSNEAEVSIHSAKNIVKYFDHTSYQLVLIYWAKNGTFFIVQDIDTLDTKTKLSIEDFKNTFDIALPITHGKYGEDWVLQSIFAMQHIPYCGCHHLSSALCMDKSLFKLFLSGHDIPQTKFVPIDLWRMNDEMVKNSIQEIKKTFALPLYVKPANSWSSVGISKITAYEQLDFAIKQASNHDSKILIEEGLISPQEIEIAILGNSDLIVSQPGELVLAKDFYNYEDKYTNNEATIRIPAVISDIDQEKIKDLAMRVYKLCDCSWFARIDFFIANKTIYLNEINTLPGFTDISMFPLLMTHTWLSYTQLINKIISLAY